MVNKFLIAIAAIIVVMAALVAVPSIGKRDIELNMNYVRDHISKVGNGILDVTTDEVLKIESDGSAIYTKNDFYPTKTTAEKKFSLNSDELKKLRSLIFETGFMQIPVSRYNETQGLSNYTRYQISVYQGNNQKTIDWFDPDSSSVPVPSIITNIGSQLDAIISENG